MMQSEAFSSGDVLTATVRKQETEGKWGDKQRYRVEGGGEVRDTTAEEL